MKNNFTSSILSYHGIIYEYDIKAAGLTMIEQSNALSKQQIQYFKNLPKKDRVVELGYLMKEDNNLIQIIEKGIKKAVKDFCSANDIQLSDIISVKKDAVFSIKKANKLNINEVIFDLNNKFNLFINLDSIELYWDTWSQKVVWKGLGEKVTNDNWKFLKFIKSIIKASEKGSHRDIALRLNDFRSNYILFKLDQECYKECRNKGMYRLNKQLKASGNILFSESFPEWENLDPIYNYTKFVLPILKALWK